MTLYCIYEKSPVYCGITDAKIGSRTKALPMTYFSLPLARKIAARTERQHYENCGDNWYFAGEVGTFKPVHIRTVSAEEFQF